LPRRRFEEPAGAISVAELAMVRQANTHYVTNP
jgi:hypothetical protein